MTLLSMKPAPKSSAAADQDVSAAVGYLFRYMRPFLHLIALGTLLSVATRGLVLLLPQLASRIINMATVQVDPTTLNATGALFLALVLAVAGLQFAEGMVVAYVGEKIVLGLRRDIFAHILSLSLNFFERRRVGDLMSRVATDAAVMREIGMTLPFMSVSHGVTVIGVVVIVMLLNAKLTLTLLAFLPAIALSAAIMGRVVRRLAVRSQDNIARSNVAVEEALSGIATVKAFAQEDGEVSRYTRALSEVFRSSIRLSLAMQGTKAISLLVVFGGLACVLWYATTLILAGSLTTGELVAFMMYGALAGNSLAALAGVWSGWERLRGTCLRLVQIFDERPSVADRPDAVRFDGSHQTIAFRHVTFSYPTEPERKVLSDLDFSFERGQHIALVGESGAGKSTLVALLLRLYDVTEGSITIDGCDIRGLVQNDLRRSVAVVPQDVVVFGRSVRENILYGNRDATEEELVAAARAAHALDFVEQMPEGFDTVLGERGVTISGGQRQRIAIARAMLKNPSILVLDEATSALDKPSEESVREGLANLMKGRTTFVIAHRLSTIESADRVLVLHHGRLVESGSHAELLEAGGHYARLYRTGAWQEGQVA